MARDDRVRPPELLIRDIVEWGDRLAAHLEGVTREDTPARCARAGRRLWAIAREAVPKMVAAARALLDGGT